MKLTVIIVNYNVRHFLEQCLISVLQAMRKIDGEIIVVDNNSADGSCSMIISNFPEIKLIRNSSNLGFAKANNQAIKIASGEFILLLNPDTVVEEETFHECIGFMDANKDAGAAGVKMIDGKGKFLPESKRALPTPLTAFYKIFGLNLLFPGSKSFNRYYLGHLSENEIHKIDVLTGAFMFIRKEALDKAGLFDEDYFMYGEDIDLSYRLMKTGYNNYYLPEPSIIHYKGESTRRSDFNLTKHFYKSMLIFVKKHFGKEKITPLILIINVAIFLRAGLSFSKKILGLTLLPVTDWAMLFLVYRLIIRLWEFIRYDGGYNYPDIFNNFVVPGYISVWIISIALWKGYRFPVRLSDLLKGLVTGIAVTFIVYALLPSGLRFSRALLIIGSAASLLLIPLSRYIYSLAGFIRLPGSASKPKKVLVISSLAEYNKILEIIEQSRINYRCVGRVKIDKEDEIAQSLGNIEQMNEIVRVNGPDEIIFGSELLPSSQIISMMKMLSGTNVGFKIARTGSEFVIGSKSRFHQGEIYSISLSDKK